jgi:hypothetical protein
VLSGQRIDSLRGVPKVGENPCSSHSSGFFSAVWDEFEKGGPNCDDLPRASLTSLQIMTVSFMNLGLDVLFLS